MPLRKERPVNCVDTLCQRGTRLALLIVARPRTPLPHDVAQPIYSQLLLPADHPRKAPRHLQASYYLPQKKKASGPTPVSSRVLGCPSANQEPQSRAIAPH